MFPRSPCDSRYKFSIHYLSALFVMCVSMVIIVVSMVTDSFCVNASTILKTFKRKLFC